MAVSALKFKSDSTILMNRNGESDIFTEMYVYLYMYRKVAAAGRTIEVAVTASPVTVKHHYHNNNNKLVTAAALTTVAEPTDIAAARTAIALSSS